MRAYLIGVFVVFLVLFKSDSVVACNLNLDTGFPGQVYTWTSGLGNYDPFDSTEYTNTVEFVVQKLDSDDVCDFFIAFTEGASDPSYDRYATITGGGLDTLQYQLINTDNPLIPYTLKDYVDGAPDASDSNEVLSGSVVSPNVDTIVSFGVLVDPNQVVPPGTYEDTITVKLFGGTYGAPSPLTPLQSITVTVRIVVDSVVYVEFDANTPVNADIATSVFFVDPNVDDIETKSFVVQSNDAYTVTATSGSDSGVMQHSNDPTVDPILYRIGIMGETASSTFSEEVPFQLVNNPTASDPAGDTYTLEFIIDQADVVAGTYADTVILTISTE